MEELRIVLLSIAGLVFIVRNYQRRQGELNDRQKDPRSPEKTGEKKGKAKSRGRDQNEG